MSVEERLTALDQAVSELREQVHHQASVIQSLIGRLLRLEKAAAGPRP